MKGLTRHKNLVAMKTPFFILWFIKWPLLAYVLNLTVSVCSPAAKTTKFMTSLSYIQTSTGRNISFPTVGIILLSFSIKCIGSSTIWPWTFFNSLRACSGSVSARVFSVVVWFSSAKLSTKSEGIQLNTYKWIQKQFYHRCLFRLAFIRHFYNFSFNLPI